MKMYQELVMGLFLTCMVLADSRKCKKESDCSESECCVIFRYEENFIGECSKLGKEGSRCSRFSDKLKSLGGKYDSICPCEKPFDCKDKKDINLKRKYLRCVNETYNTSSKYIKAVNQIVKRYAPFSSEEDLGNDDTDSSFSLDQDSIKSHDVMDKWIDITLHDETTDTANKWEDDTDEKLKEMWENDQPMELKDLKQGSEQKKDQQTPINKGRNYGIFVEERTVEQPELSGGPVGTRTINDDGISINMKNSFGQHRGKEVNDFDHPTRRPIQVDQKESVLNRELTQNYEHILKFLQKLVDSQNEHVTKDVEENGWLGEDVGNSNPPDEDTSFKEEKLNLADYIQANSEIEADWNDFAVIDATIPSDDTLLMKNDRTEGPEQKLATDSSKNVKSTKPERELHSLQHMDSVKNEQDSINNEYEEGSLGEEKSFIKKDVSEEDVTRKIIIEKDPAADYMDEFKK